MRFTPLSINAFCGLPIRRRVAADELRGRCVRGQLQYVREGGKKSRCADD